MTVVAALTPESLRHYVRTKHPRLWRWLRLRLTLEGRLIARLLTENMPIVLSGPFRGMRLLDEACGASSYPPKILGSYESLLHGWIAQVVSSPPPIVVNIGCAEGYYAVGLARLCPSSRVLAYDTSEKAQDMCRAMARLNGVEDRVEIHGTCTPDELCSLAGSRGLLICDCEGAELALFSEQRIAALSSMTFLIECHDHLAPEAGTHLVERFWPTHRIDLAYCGHLDVAEAANAKRLSRSQILAAADEGRRLDGYSTPQLWIRCTPRQGTAESERGS